MARHTSREMFIRVSFRFTDPPWQKKHKSTSLGTSRGCCHHASCSILPRPPNMRQDTNSRSLQHHINRRAGAQEQLRSFTLHCARGSHKFLPSLLCTKRLSLRRCATQMAPGNTDIFCFSEKSAGALFVRCCKTLQKPASIKLRMRAHKPAQNA